MANKIDIIINAVDKATGPIGKVSGALGGLAKGALKAVAIGGAAAAAGLAAVGGAAFKLAMDAAPLQGVQDAFGGLAEAAGQGSADMLKALQDASYGMVTNKDLMMSFNQAAQLVSKDFAVKLPDAMGYLGKVSLATGQDMGFMLDSLVKGVGRLSPMILDNLGIQVSLEEATANAAATFGVQAEELSKSQIQAGMMNVVLEKLAENTAAMPEVTGTATQTFESFKTTLKNVKDQIGLALLPTATKMAERLSEFAKEVLPLVIEWIEKKFIPALEATWDFIDKNLIPIIKDVYEWLKTNLPPVIAALADFWKNVLLPAITAVWSWMSTVLIPFLSGTVYPWLKDNIPKAIQTLSDFWTNTLKPAISAVWSWMSTVLIPFLQNTVFPWLGENIPKAIQTLSDFWTETLKPAIEAVWKFLTVDMMPIWEALADLLTTVVGLAITTLAGLWENILKPALDAIWKFIRDNVVPWFKKLSEGVGGVTGAIQGVVDWIKTLTDKLKNIKLPDWLTPGSPTPFEMGLRGISDMLDEISTKRLPSFNANLKYAGATAAATSGNITNFYLSANYANAQSESSIAADVRMLSLLYG